MRGTWYSYARERLYLRGEVTEQGEAVLTTQQIREVLGRQLRLQPTVQRQVIKEMISDGAVRRLDKQRILVKKA